MCKKLVVITEGFWYLANPLNYISLPFGLRKLGRNSSGDDPTEIIVSNVRMLVFDDVDICVQASFVMPDNWDFALGLTIRVNFVTGSKVLAGHFVDWVLDWKVVDDGDDTIEQNITKSPEDADDMYEKFL